MKSSLLINQIIIISIRNMKTRMILILWCINRNKIRDLIAIINIEIKIQEKSSNRLEKLNMKVMKNNNYTINITTLSFNSSSKNNMVLINLLDSKINRFNLNLTKIIINTPTTLTINITMTKNIIKIICEINMIIKIIFIITNKNLMKKKSINQIIFTQIPDYKKKAKFKTKN